MKEIPEDVLAKVNWPEVIERLTAVAHQRQVSGSIENAKQLAKDAVAVLLNPKSTVIWDYENEPDPSWCLGSILNGLLRNYFRKKSTNFEIATEVEQVEHVVDGEGRTPTPEDRLIACDLRRKVLSKVYELSEGDDLVQSMAALAEDGVLDVDDQAKELNELKPRIYEARRRFSERIKIARQELEKGP